MNDSKRRSIIHLTPLLTSMNEVDLLPTSLDFNIDFLFKEKVADKSTDEDVGEGEEEGGPISIGHDTMDTII